MNHDDEITLTGLQRMVDEWITTIGHGYFSPLTNMAVLAEETGEVARQMSRIYGDQTFKPGEAPNLADELADVVWVVAAIANQTGVDLTEAMRRNVEKKTRRDINRHAARHSADIPADGNRHAARHSAPTDGNPKES